MIYRILYTISVAGMVQSAAADGTVLIGTLNGLAPMNRERIKAGEEPYLSGQLLTPSGLNALLQPFGTVKMIGADTGNEKTAAESVTGMVKLKTAEVPDSFSDIPFIVAALHLD